MEKVKHYEDVLYKVAKKYKIVTIEISMILDQLNIILNVDPITIKDISKKTPTFIQVRMFFLI